MLDLIKDNYRLIQVLSRFGIPMGFGDDSVSEICKKNGVDTDTFLLIVNFMMNPDLSFQLGSVSIDSIVKFLRQSHVYFLEFCLPAIRRKLIDGITLKDSDVSFLILKLFDEYVAEVTSHMDQEEKTLFPYIEEKLANPSYEDKDCDTYSDHHENVGNKLRELKSIIIKYCPVDAKTNLLNAALYDIYRCEEELKSHGMVEDFLLLPALKHYEDKIIMNNGER